MELTSRILPTTPHQRLEDYLAAGGGRGLTGARAIGADSTIAEITAAGVRGRGGAGFPAGVKWRSVAHGGGPDDSLSANGAEGEPGTFKDRALLRSQPVRWCIEGLLISATAAGASETYLVDQGSFATELEHRAARDGGDRGRRMARRIDPDRCHGPRGVPLRRGKGAARGHRGQRTTAAVATALPARIVRHRTPTRLAVPEPRPAPPRRAVEPDLGEQRGDAGAGRLDSRSRCRRVRVGRHRQTSPGTWSAPSSGTSPPGVIEVAMGTPLARDDRPVRRSAPRTADQGGLARASPERRRTRRSDSTPLSYEALQSAGSGLGAAGFIVYDDTACMVEVAAPSPGSCVSSRAGSARPASSARAQMTETLERIGQRPGRRRPTSASIQNDCASSPTPTAAPCRSQEQIVIASILRTFPEDFAAHLEGRCPSQRELRPHRRSSTSSTASSPRTPARNTSAPTGPSTTEAPARWVG